MLHTRDRLQGMYSIALFKPDAGKLSEEPGAADLEMGDGQDSGGARLTRAEDRGAAFAGARLLQNLVSSSPAPTFLSSMFPVFLTDATNL
jgi:hypothetical protein